MKTQYSVGLIGCKFGTHLARAVASRSDLPFRIKTVCDLDSTLAQTLAAEIKADATSNYRQLLADPEIDAIALMTGPNGRARLLHEIISAGKDVMTTKPFETRTDEARWIFDEARKMGRVIHLNSPPPVISNDLLTILDWEKKYNLGRPAYFFASIHASYHETADGSWYDDHARCPAPPIFRLGIYLINDVQTLWGATRTVRLVETRLRTGRPTADNAVLALEMANGAVGSIAASFCVEDGDHYRNSLQISYERGTIYRDLGPQRGDTKSGCHLQLVQEIDKKRAIVATAETQGNSNIYNWTAFAEAIANRQPADEAYAERVVNGLEIVNKIALEEKRNSTDSV